MNRTTLAPLLACVTGNGGVRSPGEKPKGSLFHPGVTGEGQTGRVNRVNLR